MKKIKNPQYTKKIQALRVQSVRVEGLEPPWVTPLDPKSSTSTNFATPASVFSIHPEVSPKTECKFIDYLGIKKSAPVFRKDFSLKYIYQ